MRLPATVFIVVSYGRYGCEKKPGKDASPLGPGMPVPGSVGGLECVPARHQERIFPLMLALNAPDLFSYRACNFKVTTRRQAGTAHAVALPACSAACPFILTRVQATTWSSCGWFSAPLLTRGCSAGSQHGPKQITAQP